MIISVNCVVLKPAEQTPTTILLVMELIEDLLPAGVVNVVNGFGPEVSVTTFKDEAEALSIANDTLYGLGAGVWTRDILEMQSLSRGIEAGRVWCNCYHAYPAHASFGGYKKSGIGRETHRMMLNHYRHTKNVLTSYSQNPLGFF